MKILYRVIIINPNYLRLFHYQLEIKMFLLNGKRIIVTGASRGIGFGISKILARHGALLYLTSLSPNRLEKAVQKIEQDPDTRGKVVGYTAADLSKPGNGSKIVKEALESMNGLDGIVYVPPPPPPGFFDELTLEDWKHSSQVLIHSAIEIVKTALDSLKESARLHRNPGIVFVTSIAAWEPDPVITTSSALRIALHGLTQVLARDLGRYGIRVNAIVPGYILTDRLMSLAAKRMPDNPERYLDSLRGKIPLGRIGTTEDMGYAALFLLSDLSSYINGAIIPVDGGLHRKTI